MFWYKNLSMLANVAFGCSDLTWLSAGKEGQYLSRIVKFRDLREGLAYGRLNSFTFAKIVCIVYVLGIFYFNLKVCMAHWNV